MHDAVGSAIIEIGKVLGGTVVPYCHIACLPMPAHLKIRMGGVGKQEAQQSFAFGFGELIDVGGETFADKQAFFCLSQDGCAPQGGSQVDGLVWLFQTARHRLR